MDFTLPGMSGAKCLCYPAGNDEERNASERLLSQRAALRATGSETGWETHVHPFESRHMAQS